MTAVTPWSFSQPNSRRSSDRRMASFFSPANSDSMVSRTTRLAPTTAYRKPEPDEQPFEVVLARFLDLAALDADVVDRELFRLDQRGQVEAERRDVAGHLLGVLLERDEHAGFVELERAIHQECERQQASCRIQARRTRAWAGPSAARRA